MDVEAIILVSKVEMVYTYIEVQVNALIKEAI